MSRDKIRDLTSKDLGIITAKFMYVYDIEEPKNHWRLGFHFFLSLL